MSLTNTMIVVVAVIMLALIGSGMNLDQTTRGL
jgi:hypothetical protein